MRGNSSIRTKIKQQTNVSHSNKQSNTITADKLWRERCIPVAQHIEYGKVRENCHEQEKKNGVEINYLTSEHAVE
jgi:hypothetical protein